MKIRPTTYTFDASAKTIDCASFTSLEAIQLITNVTDNVIIYNFADPAKGGTLTSTTLTLTYDTTSMADTDKLQILVETGSTTESVSGTVTANAGTNLNTSALALETGGNLASIKTNTDKIPAQGQALAAASMPVVLPAAQITALTPPAAITGFATAAKQDTIDTSINTLLKPASTLAAVTSITNVVHVDDNGGALTVDGTVTANLSATDNAVLDDIASNQTDASQKTQIVDGAGNVIGATSNALDVNIKSGSSSGVQYTEGDTDATITGTAIMFETNTGTSALGVVNASNPLPVSVTGGGDASAANQTTIIGHVDGIETLLGTIDADTSNLSTKIDTIAGAVAGTEVQVDVLTMPTTTVQATNLDIRDLTNATDSVAIYGSDDGGTTKRIIKTDSGGAIQVDLEVTSVTANAGTNLNTSALALEAGGNLAAIKAKTDNIPAQGQALASASLPVVLPATQIATLTPPAAITGFATSAKQDTIIGHVDGIETLIGTSNSSLSTIAGKDFATQTTLAAMNAKMVSGTDIGDVTINNASGASAVNIQDGGNTITVDGTVTANAILSAETTKVIGTVNIAASQTVGLATGSNAIGKLAANSGVDIGDVDVTSLPALAAGTNAIGKLLPSDIDVTAHTNYIRKYYTSAGAATDGIIWSPAAGKRWHVVTMYIQTSADATITLEDDKAGGDDPVWKGEIAAKSGVVLSFTEKYPMASGEDAADLMVTTSAGNVYITCVGYEI